METSPGHALMKKGKRGAAAFILAECLSPGPRRSLDDLLNILLNPVKSITEWDSIDWIKWLMAGGRTPDDFSHMVRRYDSATTCGLVWTANFVAYRCRTCGISPCMSLCAECFQRGDHSGHDFNMFRSQAGGACDCGDTSVMRSGGFCDRHGPERARTTPSPPVDLTVITEAIAPRLLYRLLLHLREHGNADYELRGRAIADADSYLGMLHEIATLGAATRNVITQALVSREVYKELKNCITSTSVKIRECIQAAESNYRLAISSLPNPNLENLEEHKDIKALADTLKHRTLLEELVFWTVRYEFPQKIVCLLLNMLPDPDYKTALTEAFVLHYPRISQMLEKSNDPDTLSNRVVHVSVQLFSNEALALKMVETQQLLHVMVVSLRYMMCKILVSNTLHDPKKNFHFVVDCARPVMKNHCYWPLVSDLNNVLSHRLAANAFMSDPSLLEMWCTFLSMFQGMNVNIRELNQHVEFEPNTYYAAFSAELEASAYPMWALLSHLRDPNTFVYTSNVLDAVISALNDWFDAIGARDQLFGIKKDFEKLQLNQVSFHLPLHRYLATFMFQAISVQGKPLSRVLPNSIMLQLLMIHPLRIQVAFYEILNGLWVRNGLQIKGQAMTYIQCNFCNSMVDADLYLLQICATVLPPHQFLDNVFNRFHLGRWLRLASSELAELDGYYVNASTLDSDSRSDIGTMMLESCLTFLTSLVCLRTNLAPAEDTLRLTEIELVTLLVTSDKTHSQLMELMPERSGGGGAACRDFERVLSQVAEYKAPALEALGNMLQGMYVPKSHVWDELFDPIHVLLRAVHRRDFQSSMDRYNTYLVQSGKMRAGNGAWAPFRDPGPVHSAYSDPKNILLSSKIFHAFAWVVLYKYVTPSTITITTSTTSTSTSSVNAPFSEHVLSLLIHLLDMAVTAEQENIRKSQKENSTLSEQEQGIVTVGSNTGVLLELSVPDRDFENWFETDWFSQNLRTVISSVKINTSDLPPAKITSTVSREPWVISGLVSNVTEVDDRIDLHLLDSDTCRLLALPPLDIEQSESSDVRIVPSTQCNSENLIVAYPNTETQNGYVNPKESIISMLLKLHSHLSGIQDSFDPTNPPQDINSKVGDGPYFVGRLLHRIMKLDESCKEAVLKIISELWPKRSDAGDRREKEEKEREERRKRAKERQQKLIEEFASRQKQFMAKAMESEDGMECENNFENETADIEMRDDSKNKDEEYDCVICSSSATSTKNKPMGLVVLMQGTSILGHMRSSSESRILPTSDEERYNVLSRNTSSACNHNKTRAEMFDARLEDFHKHFDKMSLIYSLHLGLEGGVHVQTCGHTLHLDCLKSYLESLATQPRLAAEVGEYLCPLCRRLANSVLPLPSITTSELSLELNPTPGLAHNQLYDIKRWLEKLSNSRLGESSTRLSSRSAMNEAIEKAMADISNSTYNKFRTKIPGLKSAFLFISSIARVNLEIDLIERGGTLVSYTSSAGSSDSNTPSSSIDPNVNHLVESSSSIISNSGSSLRRSSFLPLLHVLSSELSSVELIWPAWITWSQLTGLITDEEFVLNSPSVPLLLQDSMTLLIHFILLLPLHVKIEYFSLVVNNLYLLTYWQILIQLSVELSDDDRKQWSNLNQNSILAIVLDILESNGIYDQRSIEFNSTSASSGIPRIETIHSLLLPFLRLASLLKYYIYSNKLPDMRKSEDELEKLSNYLEVPVISNNSLDLCRMKTVKSWAEELCVSLTRNAACGRSLISTLHRAWLPPKLLDLPLLYDRIFQYYHRKQCNACQSVPRETSICLLCGALVCLKENCCKKMNVCEAVAHSIDCGAGTALYLVVTSSSVIVIRNRRACLWGSVYLDSFGEEDRELKRGKPLYLSPGRYQLLQQQWLQHKFDHIAKKWIWHRDAL